MGNYLFTDPLAETDPVTPDPSQPNILPILESNPALLLKDLGIVMKQNTIIEMKNQRFKSTSTPNGPKTIPYLPWFQIRNDSINKESIVQKTLR